MSAARAVGCAIGSITILLQEDSGSQYLCTWGADADGFAPHTIKHAASLIARGSNPAKELPIVSLNASSLDLLHTVSGSTSVAPRRLKNRNGKLPAIAEQVPV